MSDTGAVERAARGVAEWFDGGSGDPVYLAHADGDPNGAAYNVARAALAAAAPTVEEVAEVLYRADVPTRMDGLAGAPEWKRREYMTKAEQVAALWGAR